MNCSENDKPDLSPRILIVDDEADISSMVEMLLTEEGYRAVTAVKGEDALAYIREHEVDLVLLDIMMPGMDGLTVARTVKEEICTDRFIPIIMVSALRTEDDKIAGLAYADDYVTKPFSYDELLARIRSMLRIRQLQRELFLSRSRYQCLYEHVPEMCISLDRHRRISDCNKAFELVSGLPRARILGQCFSSFFTDKHKGQVFAFLDTVSKTERPSHDTPVYETVFVDDDNHHVMVSMRALDIGEHESGLSTVVALQDQTRRIRLEQEQKMARRQLYRSARLASIGTLSSGVAHELNNPLAAIMGFSDALIFRLQNKEAVDAEELRQYLGIINSETLRCRDIVENLARFSRDSEPQIVDIKVEDCVQSALTLISSRAQKRGMNIENRVEKDMEARADAQKVTQVLINILSNCLDFCKEGCHITIEAEKELDGRFVRLKVQDTGPGISPEVLPRVFDPFFTTKEVGKGTGLGLSICHKIMEECEGDIDIFSEPGTGTQVVIDIPCRK
ncbi:MAG: ATP-binding protein [Chitinivibrionales bacterium]